MTESGGAGAPSSARVLPWSAAFAADLHLAAADRDGIARAIAMVELCAANTRRLFLLGDVFDLWTSGAELSLVELEPLFAALRRARDAGLAIEFVAGNRDFNFAATDGASVGVLVHEKEELRLDLDGRRFVLLHGDQLLSDDRAYQRMKKVIRAPAVRYLARHLPGGISLALGRRIRRYSERVVPAKPNARLRIVPAAVRERLGEGETMVCGHVHRLERIDYGGGRELLVLPPFFEEGRLAVLAGKELRIASLDGALVPLPPARPAEMP